MIDNTIRARACPDCYLCGTKGVLLYHGMQDRLFGVPGEWSFRLCPNPHCRLLWLDPSPIEEDIGKTYAKYHTHAPISNESNTGELSGMLWAMRKAYWSLRYGYRTNRSVTTSKVLGLLMCLRPYRRAQADMMVRYLPVGSGGRLLDVGCGSGEWLVFMASLGWRVEGVDPDFAAVEAARKRGLTVRCGSLEEQGYPDGHFEALTLNHVLEHVRSPQALLRECRRVLKQGAPLVLVTPNSESIGHRLFKKSWRGLEPPRHLQLMTMKTVARLAQEAGFEVISLKTETGNRYIFEQSYAIRHNAASDGKGVRVGRMTSWIAHALVLAEMPLFWAKPGVGEVIVLVATASPETKSTLVPDSV